MNRPSNLSGCARRVPCQKRGEERVGRLLDAAVAEFAAEGYENATMSGIAKRASSPIGSLYQFFPNKEAVARAVRTRHVEDVEQQWDGLTVAGEHGEGAIESFVATFINLMVEFVRGHPAFLALQDAPTSTQPVGPRNRLIGRLAEMFRTMQPRLNEAESLHLSELVLMLNKTLMGMYARAKVDDGEWIVAEYRSLLSEMLSRRLMDDRPKRRDVMPPIERTKRSVARKVG
jgi:AcrR family transcriptional regulator